MELLSKQAFCRSLFAVLAFAGCMQAQTLKKFATIDLPGPKGERFDYLTMDALRAACISAPSAVAEIVSHGMYVL